MGYIKRHRINATVTATGGGTQNVFSDYIPGGGYVEAIRFTSAAVSGFATGVRFVITAERSGLDILAVSNATQQTWYPRAQAQSTGGVALGFTSAATPPAVPTRIPVADERIQIAISSAGTASNGGLRGTFDLYVSGF